MTTLISLLRQARPRRIPLHPQKGCASIVYADAYFKLGERLWKVGHASPKHWTRQATTELENGWGFLVKTGDVVSAAHGRVPAEIIRLFSSHKAYIFFLEVNAQILALLANRERLSRFWVCFIDNSAGLAALARGFSREPAINHLLAFFWCLISSLGWFGHFEWVSSKLNPADPISRGDTQGAVDRQAVFLREVPDGYWRLLSRVAGSMEFACGSAVQCALELSFHFGEK